MPVVEEAQRLAALRRLGLSEPLVRLSSGEPLHPAFQFRCSAPPWYSYHGAGCPDGPPLVPLWDCGDTVTAVWERNRRPEFIEFGIETSAEYTVLARTEQGLWATVFAVLAEDEDAVGMERLREPAGVVGFRYLDRLNLSAGGGESQVSTFNGYWAWLQAVVGDIDSAEE